MPTSQDIGGEPRRKGEEKAAIQPESTPRRDSSCLGVVSKLDHLILKLSAGTLEGFETAYGVVLYPSQSARIETLVARSQDLWRPFLSLKKKIVKA